MACASDRRTGRMLAVVGTLAVSPDAVLLRLALRWSLPQAYADTRLRSSLVGIWGFDALLRPAHPSLPRDNLPTLELGDGRCGRRWPRARDDVRAKAEMTSVSGLKPKRCSS